jgi:general secretion pathway protein F
MPAFHYVAVNQMGREQKGVIEAENEKQARRFLRDKTLIPLRIRPASEKKSSTQGSFKTFGSSLNSKELALFTRQFATLLTAGLPIEEALFAVSEQTEKARMKGLILSVRGKVVEGHSLAHALGEHPTSFSALFCATIAAGEKSGHLDKVLLRLADYTEQQANLAQKLRTALIYPTMIVLVAVGIVGFLLEYVVPKMVAVYGRFNQNLPTMTQVLIATSNFIKNDGLYIVMGLVACILVFRRALKKNEKFREKTHLFLLRMPFTRYAIKTSNTARFARTLSILSASGVPVLEAMTISAQLITNIPVRKSIEGAVSHVREGKAIHLSLKQTGYFSPMSVHMIASGESSGQLEGMLDRSAHHQEEEITRLIDVSLALFEPAIILIMGAIVLFIVLAVLLPIFEVNQFTG